MRSSGKVSAEGSDIRRTPLATLARVLWLAMIAAPASAQVLFQDVTVGSGVEYTGESYGASWGDANGDRLPDLFVSHHRYVPGLYINLGNGTFENREFEVDVWQTVPRSDIHGATWADYNNDGWSDLVITAGSKNFTQFLVNNGSFLTDRIDDFTFDRKAWGGRLPFWFDFTNDGFLDLAIAAQGEKFQLHEQVGGDFLRRNSVSGHECDDNDYAHLSDLTLDGQVDWVCVRHGSFPDRIYDYTIGVPFSDQSILADPAVNVIDSAIADFDGDQIMDLFALRGKVRVTGADLVSPRAPGLYSLEAHLIDSAGSESGITFQTGGDLSIELHWSGRNAAQIFIGASGFHPPFPSPGVPITIELSASDPNVVGVQSHDPTVDRGIYIGFDPATQTWTYFNSSGDGAFSYTYSYIDSTAPISNLDVTGILAQEAPRAPALLKFTGSSYTDQIASTGLDHPVLCNSVAAADFDNDMDIDLYYVCRGPVLNRPNRLYLNDGTGFFTPVAGPFGAEGPVGSGVGLGENVVASDYDVDGFVDLFVMNGLKLYPELIGYSAGGPDKLFRNLGNSNNWIEFDLTGTLSNRDGIGATVIAVAGGVTQRREQNGGYHRWAQHDQRIHFGLGANATADITVNWPSGQVDTYLGVAANGLYEIVEGNTTVNAIVVPTTTAPSVCGQTAGPPVYDPAVDREIFIWKDDCGSSNWKVRMTGGDGPTLTYVGDVQSEAPLQGVAGYDLEPGAGDVFDFLTNATRIDYALTVGAGREDGFEFTVDPSVGTCFGATSNIATALGGYMRTPLTLPFDLETLGPCSSVEPIVSIDDVVVVESAAAGLAVFTVTLSAQSASDITVNYTTVDGDATSPEDFIAVTDTLTFLAGEDTKTIEVAIVNDGVAEAAETFSVVLSAPINAVLGDSTGMGTIVDDEPSACGQPVYDKGTEHALFVWKDCITDEWSVRVTAGGQTATFIGDAVSTQAFSSVTPFSIEPTDLLDFVTEPTVISFQLLVGNAGQDGFDFTLPPSALVCLDLSAPGVPVFLGENRTPISLPIDLGSLGSCIVAPTADLVTVKTLSSGDPMPLEGDTVGFLITVTNNGPDEATNVVLTDDLPSGLTPTAGSGAVSQGAYGAGTWNLGTLPVGASATLTLEGTVDSGQTGATITNTTSTAAGDQVDPGTSGDQLSASVTVDPGLAGADLVTTKILASGNPTPSEGEAVTYLLTVTNNGPAEATNVTLSDVLPAGLSATINNGLASQGNYSAGVWSIGALPAASSATLTLEGTVDFGQSGNTITNVTTAAGGDQADISAAGDDLSETVVVDGPSETPLTAWSLQTGGVTTVSNQIIYSGTPEGWLANTVVSQPLSTLGFVGDYEVRWTLDSDPAATTWVVGLGISETTANWRDVDYGLRSSAGVLRVYESGTWRTTGNALVEGDVISIVVSAGLIEYRHNDVTFYSTAIVGQPDFYVDSSFRSGGISMSVVIVGAADPVTPPTETPITAWPVTTGGVSAISDAISYSGLVNGWVSNTANSAILSSLGASGNYAVRWEIGSDPSAATWIVGLGVVETDSSWRDVDYGIRGSSGLLQIYENGSWVATGSTLLAGDELAIHVQGTQLEYRLNGTLVNASTIAGTEDFYIDSSFKQGAVDLISFTLVE